jgi:hypothetical protein
MIIGLQGYAGSGKSTVASYLVERYGFARRHIKFPLAKMFVSLLIDSGLGETHDQIERYVNGDLKRTPIPEIGGRTATEIQQFLGTEFGRNFIHPDLWLDIWSVWAAGHERVVQESVRFANEAERCDVVWEIRREGYGAHNGHVSEGLPCAEPVILWNNGSVEELYRQVDEQLGA